MAPICKVCQSGNTKGAARQSRPCFLLSSPPRLPTLRIQLLSLYFLTIHVNQRGMSGSSHTGDQSLKIGGQIRKQHHVGDYASLARILTCYRSASKRCAFRFHNRQHAHIIKMVIRAILSLSANVFSVSCHSLRWIRSRSKDRIELIQPVSGAFVQFWHYLRRATILLMEGHHSRVIVR